MGSRRFFTRPLQFLAISLDDLSAVIGHYVLSVTICRDALLITISINLLLGFISLAL
jgi:hypothetical protein